MGLQDILNENCVISRRDTLKLFGLLPILGILGCEDKSYYYSYPEGKDDVEKIGTVLAGKLDNMVDERYIKKAFYIQKKIPDIDLDLADLINETYFNLYKTEINPELRLVFYSDLEELQRIFQSEEIFVDGPGSLFGDYLLIQKGISASNHFNAIAHALGHTLDDARKDDFVSSIFALRLGLEIYNSFPNIGKCEADSCEEYLYWIRETNPFVSHVYTVLEDLKTITNQAKINSVSSEKLASSLLLKKLSEGCRLGEIEDYFKVSELNNLKLESYETIYLNNAERIGLVNKAVDNLMIDVEKLPYYFGELNRRFRIYIEKVFD